AGYAPGHLLIANEWLAGPSGSDLIDAGRVNLAAHLAATWLRASAGIRADFLPVCNLGRLLTRAERHRRALAGADAALGAEARRCLDALRSRSPGGGAPTLRHGSYYGRHVLDVGGGPGVLDWDEACQGPIELDAGDWLAWLERHAGRTQPPERVKEAAAIFRQGIADLVEDEALRWFQAQSLLKQAEDFVADRQEGLGHVPRGVPDAIERDDLADAVIVAPDELGHRAPEDTPAPRGLKKAGDNDIAGVAGEVHDLLAAVA